MSTPATGRPKRKLEVDLTPNKRRKVMEGPTDRPPWYGSTPGSDDVVRGSIQKRNIKRGKRTKKESGKVLFQCCYCKEFYNPKDLEIEHVSPFSKIGKQAQNMSELQMIANDDANLGYACGKKGNGCNQSKSDKPLFGYLGKDQIKYGDFLDEYPEFKWMDTTQSGSMAYTPPWQPRALSGDLTEPDPAYVAQLKKMNSQRGTDYRPRLPIGREECYVNLNGTCIRPVKAVEDCCARAGVELKDVLDTTSDPYSKDWTTKGIEGKSAIIKKICWQTRK